MTAICADLLIKLVYHLVRNISCKAFQDNNKLQRRPKICRTAYHSSYWICSKLRDSVSSVRDERKSLSHFKKEMPQGGITNDQDRGKSEK